VASKKILVLVKSHDSRFVDYHNDLYENLEILSRENSKTSENVKFIYVKADPGIAERCVLDDDTLWVRHEENYWGSLKEKVLSAFDFFFRESNDFDFAFVTNLSTFVNVKKLESECNDTESFDCKALTGIHSFDGSNFEFPSGAGAIFSKDLIRRILNFVDEVDCSNYPGTDDIFIGKVLDSMGINIQQIPRVDVLFATKEIQKVIDFSSRATHTRIKFENNRSLEQEYHRILLDEISRK